MSSGSADEDAGLSLVLAIESSRATAAKLNGQLADFKVYLQDLGGLRLEKCAYSSRGNNER